MPNREYPYAVPPFIDFKNCAVNMRLGSIEELPQLPLNLSRFRGGRAAVRARFKCVHRLFQFVVPARGRG